MSAERETERREREKDVLRLMIGTSPYSFSPSLPLSLTLQDFGCERSHFSLLLFGGPWVSHHDLRANVMDGFSLGCKNSQREIKQSNFASMQHSTDVTTIVSQHSNSIIQNKWIFNTTPHLPGNNQHYAAGSKSLFCYTVTKQSGKVTQFFMTSLLV